MRRLLVYGHDDGFVFELSDGEVFGLVRTSELNGEHSLSVSTTRRLEKEQRLLFQADDGTWAEYVVQGADEEHSREGSAIGTYYCTWSLEHDLAVTTCDKMPTNATALSALEDALSLTARWSAGAVESDGARHTASFWRMSAWDALSAFAATWGGEIEPSITVDESGVASRAVNSRMHLGSSSAVRRFDYGHDVASIRRTVAEDVLPCRIIPLGKAEQTEDGGYGRKITIESVNDGIEWLENESAAVGIRLPDGGSGWEYPTAYVENGDCETPEDLKAWGLSVLDDLTTPHVAYEASVLAFADAGLDASGIALGDEVHIVDRAFGESPLRLSGRVARMEVDELDGSRSVLTIGNLSRGLVERMASIKTEIGQLKEGAASAESAIARAQHEADILSADLLEVSATATDAQEKANEADAKLAGIEGTVKDAVDAVDAKADQAGQVAADAYSIAEDLDSQMPGIIADVQAAQADADQANQWIETTGAQAAQDAADAETHAQTALTNAANAQAYAEGVNSALQTTNTELANFKTTAAQTYATKTEVDSETGTIRTEMQTNYATKAEDYASTQPNLAPFFGMPLDDSTYWVTISDYFTRLDDGWAHIARDNRSGSDNVYPSFIPAAGSSEIIAGEDYTFLVEIKNATVTGTVYVQPCYATDTSTQIGEFAQSRAFQVEAGSSVHYQKTKAKDSLNGATVLTRAWVQVNAGARIDCDIRVSLYRGDYSGAYKPCVDYRYAVTKHEMEVSSDALKSTITSEYTSAINTKLQNYSTITQTDSKIAASAQSTLNTVAGTYATKAALEVTNTNISSEVTARTNADTGLSSRIDQTAAAVETRFKDFLSVGANMLVDTDTPTFASVNSPYRRIYDARDNVEVSMVKLSNPPVGGIDYGVKWEIQASAATGYMAFSFYDRDTTADTVHGVKLVNGQKYTMAAWTYGNHANRVKGRLRLVSPAYGSFTEMKTILSETFDFSYGWKFVQFSCECDQTRIYRAFFEVSPQGQEVNAYMCGFSVYEGVPSGEYDTLIRETSAGIEVGKADSSGSYVGARSLVSSTGSFQVLDASGTMLGSMSGTSAQIGKTATNHIVANSNGVYAYDGSSNVLGSFTGTASQVGRSNTNHVITNANGVYIRDGDGTNLAALTPSAVRVGRSGYANAYISASALNFYVNETLYSYFGADEARIGRKYDDNDNPLPNVYIGKRNSTDTAGVYLRTGDTVRAAMTSNGTVIGRSDKQHLVQDANGMYIYDPTPSGGSDSPTANLKAAFTADAVRIGSRNTNAFSAYVTDQAFQIRQTLASDYAVYTTIGPETARIGRQDSGYYNVLVDSGSTGAGVYLRKNTTNLAALTDSSVVVGQADDLHAEMVPGAFRIVNGSTVRSQFMQNVACIGPTSGYNVLIGAIDDTEAGTYDGTAGVYLRSGSTVRASFTPTASTFGRSDRRHLVQNADGMYIFDPTPSGGDGTSNQKLAVDSHGVVVGSPASGYKNARMTSGGFYIREGTTNLASFTPTQISLGQNSSNAKIALSGGTSYIENEAGYDDFQQTTFHRTGGSGVELRWNYSSAMGGYNDSQNAWLNVGTRYSANGNYEASVIMAARGSNVNKIASISVHGGVVESSSSRLKEPSIFVENGQYSGNLEDWCTEFIGLNNAAGTVFGYVRKWASGRMDSVRIVKNTSRTIATAYKQGSQIMGYYGATNSYTLGGTYGAIHGAEITVIPQSGEPLVSAFVTSLGTSTVSAVLFSPVSLTSAQYTFVIKAWGMA